MREITSEEWKDFNDMFEIIVKNKSQTPLEHKFWKEIDKYFNIEEIKKGVRESGEYMDMVTTVTTPPPIISDFLNSQRWFRSIILSEIIFSTGVNKVMKLIKNIIDTPDGNIDFPKLKDTISNNINIGNINELYPVLAKELTNLLKWWLDKLGVEGTLTTPFNPEEKDEEIIVAKFTSRGRIDSMLKDVIEKGGLLL